MNEFYLPLHIGPSKIEGAGLGMFSTKYIGAN